MYKKLKPALLLLISFAINGCSNSGGGSLESLSGSGDVGNLQIITPKTIYSKSGMVGSGYIIINNPTNTAVKNIQYSLSNLTGGGNGASLDPLSSINCATVAAYSQCSVKIAIESSVVAGSIGITASINSSSLLGKLSQSAKAVTSSLQTLGVEQAAYNSLSGADGITLSYYNTVISGTPYILVSGLIASANAGNFNRIVLVNDAGIEIPNQELIGEASSTQGSTFNILLPVPSGNGATQIIKVQTQQQEADDAVAIVSTATTNSTLTTTENVGIAEMLPSAVYLTESNPEQIITFVNTGDVLAQLQGLTSNNPNVEVVFSPTSLVSGAITTAILRLKDKTVAATTGNITLTYDNGQDQTSTSGVVDQDISPTPTPTPAPTPSPTPIGPTAGLTAVFTPDNDFFTTTVAGTVDRQLTLTNTGNTDENSIVLTLPAGFTISNGSSNSCTVSGNNITNTLTTTGSTVSCDITITYTNNTITSQSAANIAIAYNYNNGIAASPVTAAVDYKVTRSTANLVLQSPDNPYSFPTTLVDGANTSEVEIFTIKNIGEVDATSINPTVNSSTLAGLFSSSSSGISNACGITLAPNATCEYGVQFGTIPDNTSAGAKAGNLSVRYKSYSTSTVADATLLANFSGQVANSGSAIFNVPTSGTAGAGFSGSWPNLSIAKNASGANATVSYTLTNTGNDMATNFVVILPSAPVGWNTPTTDCPTAPGTNLAKNASCNITIRPITTSVTTVSAKNMVVRMSWQDQDSPSGETQDMQVRLPAVTVVGPPAAVTIASTASWNTIMGNGYAFTASIADGSSTVSFADFAGIAGADFSTNSCSLDSVNGPESCVVIITPYSSASGNYSYWDPTNIANSSSGNETTVSTQANLSITVSSTNSATINGSASPQTFSNIAGTVVAPYIYLPQTGQTPSAPLDVSSTPGADGNVHTGIPWAYVTSGSTAPNPRFIDNGCDITDNLTGLTWVKDLDTVNGGNSIIWSNALSMANSGTWCSQPAGTWRMPNVNELASLINYGDSPAVWLNTAIASGGGGFSNVASSNFSYWSSSTYAKTSSSAWYVYMGSGNIGYTAKTTSYAYVLFPVRGGQ